IVLPSRIWLLVMPTSVATVPPLELPHAPAITRKAAAAANRGPILFIGLPPYLFRRLLNSLGVWWQLSTSTFTDSPQPAPQPGVRRQYQASQPVRREDHDQDQEGAIGHGRTGVLEDRGDLVGDPVLGLDELARDDRQPEGEYAAEERPGDRTEAPDHGAHQELEGERNGKRVGTDEPRGQCVERTGNTRVDGGEPKRERFVPRDVDTRRRGRDLAVADGHEGPAGSPADDVPRDPEQGGGHDEAQVVQPLVARHGRAARDAREQRACPVRRLLRREQDALRALGQVLGALDKARRYDGEREGGQREVQRRESERGNAQEEADQPREQARDWNRQQVVDVVAVNQDRGRVRADRHEGAVAKGDLPAVADQQVQAHDHDGEDQDLGPLEALEARDLRGQPDEEHQHHEHQPVARWSLGEEPSHTRRAARLPIRPFGLSTRTAMMIAKATASWRSPPTPGR